MYRLVIVLTILSLSGSEAVGPGQEWVFFAGDAKDYEIRSRTMEGALNAPDAEMILNEGVYLNFLVGSDFVRNLVKSTEEGSLLRYELLLAYAKLRFIRKDLIDGIVICNENNLNALIKVEKKMAKAFAGRSNQIYTNLDSFIEEKFSWIANGYLTSCMPKLKERFDAEAYKFEDAFERMRVFEIFIDEEKAAQRNGYPRYCNDEIQVLDSDKYKKLVSEIGNTVGKKLLINEDNDTHSQPKETKEEVRKYLMSACGSLQFWSLRDSVNFIMSAKRSVKFNREWNLMFDCGKKMGLFQLCEAAIYQFFGL